MSFLSILKDNGTSFQYTAFYDNFKFNHIDNYEYDLRKNSIPQLFVLPPFFSRFDDPINYAFRSETVKKEIGKLKKTISEAGGAKGDHNPDESSQLSEDESTLEDKKKGNFE